MLIIRGISILAMACVLSSVLACGGDDGGGAGSAGQGDGQGDGDGDGQGDGDGDGQGDGDGDGDAFASCPGPGEQPERGSGTQEDPFEIDIGVRYGGCVQADDVVAFAVDVTSGGVYTITQSNGVTDLEIYVLDSEENELAAIDEEWGGVDESDSAEIEPGTYYIGVYNNGAPMGTGDRESPFSLIVTGPQ